MIRCPGGSRGCRRALDALELTSADRFLDLGCGSGVAVRSAAAVASRAVGVDISTRMLARARGLAEGVPNVTFTEANVSSLPFEDGAFTAVLSTAAFHHYRDPAAAL